MNILSCEVCNSRAPFDGSDEYIKTRNSLVKLGMDIIAAIQGDNVFDNTESVKVAVSYNYLIIITGKNL